VSEILRKPEWIRRKLPTEAEYKKLQEKIKISKLHTVCQEAHCPNIGECWSAGVATIMILGDTCTRACRFCNVKTGNPGGVLDIDEARRVAEQLSDSNLNYVVLTCVDRDDLSDGGAQLFADTITAIKEKNSKLKIEALISDYSGSSESLQKIIDAKPDVIGHNVEVVKRLTPSVRDRRASYTQSLKVLQSIKEKSDLILSKSSLMVGLGESYEEIVEVTRDLRELKVDLLTFGQYLSPSRKHLPVKKYYTPQEFEKIKTMAMDMGFLYVASGPLVRSSYKAAELFVEAHLDK
jgi:lipoyl synthase